MKKAFLLLLFLYGLSVSAQNPGYRQKLYYTCKVWGFVKYYHSRVSNCEVNWDSVLVADLPLVKNAVTQNDFNDALDTMLMAAGPMAIDTTYFPDTLAPELKRNRDWSWISDTIFRADVRTILDTIKNNFRPHAECWVQHNASSSSWLDFPNDNPMLNTNTFSSYPDEWHRLLMLFKYWNTIRYFCPYNYVWDQSWDSTLYAYSTSFATASNDTDLCFTVKKLTVSLNDIHVNAATGSLYVPLGVYSYSPKIIAHYIPGNYVVVKSGISGISPGDKIISVNGLTPTQWEDSLRPYISAGDTSVFRSVVSEMMLGGASASPVSVLYEDSAGNTQSYSGSHNQPVGNSWFTSYYPNDTLGTVKWKKWGCNTGYVNMGELLYSDVAPMYSALQNTSTVIFDLRSYPNPGVIDLVAEYFFSQDVIVAKNMLPDVDYPGTFYWDYAYYGSAANPSPYQGRILILMNETTQSAGEYSCMILGKFPGSIKVGSQTAGTDGNISHLNLSQDILSAFTTIGVFYPNGDSTERIGIVPDSLVYPTQAGIRHHRDEVLEKALEIAQCWTGDPENNSPKPAFSVYPNPTDNLAYLSAGGLDGEKATITITDVTGKILLQRELGISTGTASAWLDLENYAAGIYFVTLRTEMQVHSEKMIRE